MQEQTLNEMQAYDVGWQAGYRCSAFDPDIYTADGERKAYAEGYAEGEGARYEEGGDPMGYEYS